MNIATKLKVLIASSDAPVEFSQGNYRLRLMPGVGRVRDVSFSIWETENHTEWEPILTGWIRNDVLIVSTWRAPGSPANVDMLLQLILAGKRHPIDPVTAPRDQTTLHEPLVVAAS